MKLFMDSGAFSVRRGVANEKVGGIWVLEVRIGQFSSAHRLFGYEGDCKNLHGHNWDLFVGVRGKQSFR